MAVPEQDLATFNSLAQSLADISGNIIRGYFRQAFAVEYKADESPVTVADREAEQAIRDHLNRHRPEDGIVGEEFGAERMDAEYVWVIDPIDGTGSFMCGRPIFGTLIALVRGGVPFLGLIDQPVTRERWVGWSGRTTLNDNPVRTRSCSRLADGFLATTSPRLFSDDKVKRFARLEQTARRVIYGGDCYNYGILAAGFLDAVVESGLKTHDYCALVPVIEGAGGKITDWKGNPIDMSSDGDVVASGDPRLHAEVVALLTRVRPVKTREHGSGSTA